MRRNSAAARNRELDGLRVEIAELRKRTRLAEHDRAVLKAAADEIIRDQGDRIARPPVFVVQAALKRLGKLPQIQTGLCDTLGHTFAEDGTNCRVCGVAWAP